MYPVPIIDALGTYTAKAPFIIEDGAIYISKAIEDFTALADRGIDVYSQYYQPNGLSEAQYAEDSTLGVKIVTLYSTTGHPTLYIPTSYILSFPSKSLVPYTDLVMSVSLGLIPDAVSLTLLESEIDQAVQDRLGVEPKIELHRLPLTGGVDYNTHVRLETLRASKMQFKPTPTAQLNHFIQRIAALEAEKARLEEALTATQL